MILKHIWKLKEPRLAKAILKDSKARGLTPPDTTACHEALVIKTVWLWPKKNITNGTEGSTDIYTITSSMIKMIMQW